MKLSALILLMAMACGGAGGDIIKGNAFGKPGAPLTMEIFSDFECPACKVFHDTEVPQLMREYVDTGKVYLIYRYFPLPGHLHGRESAEWVCAAAQIGKYRQAADMLFATQLAWSGSGKVEQSLDNEIGRAHV